jgi:hypothetical protein
VLKLSKIGLYVKYLYCCIQNKRNYGMPTTCKIIKKRGKKRRRKKEKEIEEKREKKEIRDSS